MLTFVRYFKTGMSTLNKYLVFTGIGALIVLAKPELVVIGILLFVVPGLILGCLPTAFIYGLGFAVIRMVLAGRLSGPVLNVLSAAATFALFWAIPQPSLITARNALASAKQPDIVAKHRIVLRGNVLLTRPVGKSCDSICVALLRTAGVTSVSTGDQRNGYATYWLAPAGAMGRQAEATGYGLLDDTDENGKNRLDRLRALETDWKAMLASDKMLLWSDSKPRHDFTVTLTVGSASSDATVNTRNYWSLLPEGPKRKALTITDATGAVLLRHSIVEIYAPAVPLHIGATGGLQNFRFGLGRQRLGEGNRHSAIPIERLLLNHTNVARGVDVNGALEEARTKLERALADPTRPSDDPAFALAKQWMGSFGTDSTPIGSKDRTLLVKILKDRRVPSAQGLSYIASHVSGNAVDLRRLVARRYLSADDLRAARLWITGISNLPDGAFAEQLPEEREILSDAVTARYAGGLIERQADRGVAAVPELLRLLKGFSQDSQDKYYFSDITMATTYVRSAFRRIGRSAAFARSDIERLLATPGMRDRYLKLDQQEWDVLLVVLGKPINSLRKPERLHGTNAQYRERVASLAARPYRGQQ